MKNHVPGTSAKLTDLQPGDCFVYSHRNGQNYIGMAIEPRQAGMGLDAVVIYPEHPSTAGKPGLLDHSVLRHKTLFKLTEAEIVPNSDLDRTRCGYDEFNPPAGLLFLVDGELVLLCGGEQHHKYYVSLASGKICDVSETQNFVYFTEWSIVIPDENGNKKVLAKYSPRISVDDIQKALRDE